jgi:hypothetical protein
MIQHQSHWTHFKWVLEQAIAHPESADLAQLWSEVEQRLGKLERDEKLRLAGEAIAQLAEICYARAEWMLGDWDSRWSDRPTEEPVLTEDMLSGFLRQSMSLNLEAILEDFIQTRNRQTPEDSVVVEVEKQAVLDWLDQEEKEQALAVAHDENVSEWIGLIQAWLDAHQQKGMFSAIVHDLQSRDAHLTPIAVWLGLLLGGFEIRGGETFYSRDFFVSGSPDPQEI